MKIALAQLNYHIGNFEQNTKKIVKAITDAKEQGAELIVFAELAIGGYPAKDLLRNTAFLKACYASVDEIAKYCEGIACIIGAPVPNKDAEGKPLFNAALLLADGEVKQVVKKSLLPDYDVFDEYRYFEPNPSSNCIKFKDLTIALTVCEDLWDDDGPNSYVGDLMQDLAKEHPDLIINIAASPFSYTHFENRKNVLSRNVIKGNAPLIYVNQVGAHTDIIFDGRSLALNRKGELVSEMKSFEEDLQFVELKGIDLHSEQAHQSVEHQELH